MRVHFCSWETRGGSRVRSVCTGRPLLEHNSQSSHELGLSSAWGASPHPRGSILFSQHKCQVRYLLNYLAPDWLLGSPVNYSTIAHAGGKDPIATDALWKPSRCPLW